MLQERYETSGADYRVYIYGDTEAEIEQRFWSYYNHGTTNGRFHWITDFFGYFITKKADLKEGIYRRYRQQAINLIDKNPPTNRLEAIKIYKKKLKEARKDAEEEFSSQAKEPLIRRTVLPDEYEYTLPEPEETESMETMIIKSIEESFGEKKEYFSS